MLCQCLVLEGNTRFAWAGGTYFSSYAVCCVSFWFWREKGFGSNMHVLLKVLVVCLAGCAVVSVFGSGDYNRDKKNLVICLAGCAVVSVFGYGDYDRKKSPSPLSGRLCCCVSF